MTEAPHSALYFTPTRDLWHSPTQLARCAADWDLHAATDVLDLGCGMGHWTRALAPHLVGLRSLVGVDAEQAWVDAVLPAWREAGLPGELGAVRADVHALPFADASFDLVTCQTVLIHARDVQAVLAEAHRVLRKGGKLLVCEPNNLANVMAELAADPALPIEDALDIFRFHLLCMRGKDTLGLGDNSLGERVVGLMARAGFAIDGVRLLEKVHPLTPPYATEAEQLAIAEQRDLMDRGIAGWPRSEAHRYYAAGGGSDAGFAAHYERVLCYERSVVSQIDRGDYARSGGTVQYLVCGSR